MDDDEVSKFGIMAVGINIRSEDVDCKKEINKRGHSTLKIALCENRNGPEIVRWGKESDIECYVENG